MKLCIIIGSPVAHSLSPAMHNAAYEALNIATEYHYTAKQIQPRSLEDFIKSARLKYHSLAVTMPHKESVIKFLDSVDSEAEAVGAVNTVINYRGKLTGYNTDGRGAMDALKQYTPLKGKHVAVLGTGGTARAIIYGLKKANAEVVLYGRNMEKTNLLALRFGCRIGNWTDRFQVAESEIIINTTPPAGKNMLPLIPNDIVSAGHIIFDVNYIASGSIQQDDWKAKGVIVIDGLELLLKQGLLQFELMTGHKAPEEVMRKSIIKGIRKMREI